MITQSQEVMPTLQHPLGSHYIVVRQEPFAVVTGEDLQLLKTLEALKLANETFRMNVLLEEKAEAVASRATNDLHLANREVQVARRAIDVILRGVGKKSHNGIEVVNCAERS